jgi:hypothetical protein
VKLGRWSMSRKDLPAAAVWKSLRNPEAVVKSLRGEAVPAAFGK